MNTYAELIAEIYDPVRFPELSPEDAKLLAFIRRRGGKITARDLAKSRRVYRPAQKAHEVLNRLVIAGKGVWAKRERETKGRVAVEFRYLDWKSGETDSPKTAS